MAPASHYAFGVLETARGAVPRLGVRDLDPRRCLAADRIGALRHLLVHVLHRVTGDVDARLAVRACQVETHAVGDAFLRVEHLVEMLRREVGHPERVVVLVAERRRVGQVVVERAVLDGARHAFPALEDGLGDHRAGEVVVRVVVELDEDRQEARLLHVLRLLELTRALVFLLGLGLVLGELAGVARIAAGELAIDRDRLLEGRCTRTLRALDSVLVLDLLAGGLALHIRSGVVDVRLVEAEPRGIVCACDSLGHVEGRSEEREDDEWRKQPPRGRTRR